MKLKKIDLSKTGKSKRKGNQSCYHPDISVNKIYLARIYDNFYAGKFSEQWYGFSFCDWGNAGIQLNSGGFTELYEIIP